MEMLPFYKTHSWMIKEFGFSRELGAYNLIYSFHENGKPCTCSQEEFAKFLQCSRMQAFRILKELEECQYIISEKRGARESKFYRINEETVNRMKCSCNTDVTCNTDATCNTDVTDTCNMDVTATCNMDVTATCNMDVTQIENIKENKKENEKRERARANDTAAFSPIPNHEEIKLTAEQQRELEREVNGTGRSIESYYRSLEKSMKSNGKSYEPHYETLRDWMQRDKDKAEQQRKAKGQSSNSSSIPDADLEKLMHGRG